MNASDASDNTSVSHSESKKKRQPLSSSPSASIENRQEPVINKLPSDLDAETSADKLVIRINFNPDVVTESDRIEQAQVERNARLNSATVVTSPSPYALSRQWYMGFFLIAIALAFIAWLWVPGDQGANELTEQPISKADSDIDADIGTPTLTMVEEHLQGDQPTEVLIAVQPMATEPLSVPSAEVSEPVVDTSAVVVEQKAVTRNEESSDASGLAVSSLTPVDSGLDQADVVDDSAPLITITDPRVTRAQLTTAIRGKEPVDRVDSVVFGPSDQAAKVYFFTELSKLNGQHLKALWFSGDRLMATVKLPVRSDRWRMASSKNLSPRLAGPWRVELRDASDRVLASARFDYRVEGNN